VRDAVAAHLQLENELGGYEAADARADQISDAYVAIARLVGGTPRNIAVVENATVAVALALSAIDPGPGDVLLTSRNDYISNQLMFISLAERRGVRVIHAEDQPGGGVDPDSFRRLIHEHRPRFASATWVPTNSGLIQPVAEIGRICAETEVPFVLDACQAVGQIPIDVADLHCDFLAATARKFLRGPRGVGFLYVSDRMLDSGVYPLYVDMRGALWTETDAFELVGDARRFENWEFNYAALLGMGAAARYALDVGVAEAGAYAAMLADSIRSGAAAIDGARVLDHGDCLAAIATVEFEGCDAQTIVVRLREQAINTSATERGYALLDMRAKGAHTAIRISPHYYNDEREIRIVLGALEEFGAE
jgi:selenocysteine lyase/cysteine desulfurase